MTNETKKIALIFGGMGKEHSVSVAGAKYVRGVIDSRKYSVIPVYITEDGEWILTEGEGRRTFPVGIGGRHGLLLDGEVLSIHCAIPLLHGDFGEDGKIQGALEVAGIPFVGADTVTGAVCIDKGYTGAIAASLGIPIARGVTVSRGTPERDALRAAEEIGFPVFLKPTRLGSSVGASLAQTREDFPSAYEVAAKAGTSVLIEELIRPKRELEVGILLTGKSTVISPVGEVLCDGFYSFERKYRTGTKTVCRADIDKRDSDTLRAWALTLARALEVRGTARIDFFKSGDRLLFNEINTMPGFTEDSLYPRLMAESGISPTRLFDLLIEDAVGEE